MTISEEVRAIVERETGVAVTEATPLDELPLDSLELLDLFLAIGEETQEIPEEKIASIKTVGDIVAAVS